MDKHFCEFNDIMSEAERVYKMGKIPLIGGVDEETGANVSTFFNYADGCTVVDCKALFLKKMQNAETDAELASGLKGSTLAAMKFGNWLVLHLRDGATDLKAFESDTSFPVDALFNAECPKNLDTFGAMEPEVVDPKFKVCMVTEFEEADVEDFLSHLPLDKCDMLVVRPQKK